MVDKDVLDRARMNFFRDKQTDPSLADMTFDLEMLKRAQHSEKTITALDEVRRSQYIVRARAELGKAGH